jgi:5,10-methylenetetrahydrofolate reductase
MSKLAAAFEAGATFFQTQAVFDLAQFERFAEAAASFKTRLLAGIIMLKSVKMAQKINTDLPGVAVPKELINELAGAKDHSQASVVIAARTINAIKPLCQGAHIMAIGWEALIPQVVRAIA